MCEKKVDRREIKFAHLLDDRDEKVNLIHALKRDLHDIEWNVKRHLVKNGDFDMLNVNWKRLRRRG